MLEFIAAAAVTAAIGGGVAWAVLYIARFISRED